MDQVEEVKNKLDIVEVISQYVQLKKGGRNFKGLCPFHGEKTPSFMVNPELQIFKCFGCQKGGDVIAFVQEIEGLEFMEALSMLAEKVGVELKLKKDEKKSEREQLVEIQELAAEYYHFLLTKHKVGEEARKYLKSRKITDKVIKEFKLGYSLPVWDGLYRFLVVKKKKPRELLERGGLIMESSKRRGQFYDRFRGRVMFPLFDHRGKVVAFAGRVMPGAGEEEPKYINSPETLIYHKGAMLYGFGQAREAIRQKDRVVVVEGEMDMISSFGAGVAETVAIKGSALTEEQIVRLSRLTENLILALDADVAGEAATKRGIEIAEEKGMNIKVVQVQGGKDPDDIARESALAWKKMIEKAVDIYQFYIDRALVRNDAASVEGKRRISREVVPVLARISNRVIQGHYVKKLAQALGVGEESVMSEMERVGRKENLLDKVEETKTKEPSREVGLRTEILGLIFLLGKAGRGGAARVLEMDGESVLARVLKLWLEWSGETGAFIKSLPAELAGFAAEAYLLEFPPERLERDLENALRELTTLKLETRRLMLQQLLGEAEKNGEEEKQQQLMEEFVYLSKKIQALK